MKIASTLKAGIMGALFAALCCSPAALAVPLGAFGLSAWMGNLLLPGLLVVLPFVGYAVYLRAKGVPVACCEVVERNDARESNTGG